MEPNAKRKKRKWILRRENQEYFDYTLLFIILFLLCFGLVMIYSTSSYTANIKLGKPAYYLMRQGIFGAGGIVAMLVVSKIDYHRIFRYRAHFLLFCGILLVVVLLQAKIKGASRWINLGPISFQPSEVAKLAIIIYMAGMASSNYKKMGKLGPLYAMSLPALAAIGLITIENLSTGIVCGAIWFFIIVIVSPRTMQILFSGGAIAALGAVVFLLQSGKGYRLERFQIWLDPEHHEKGYQTMQALYAIGSGGLFGKGLGQSIQKLGFIPESHNDMIFSVICEELGLFGAICIIGMFLFLITRLIDIVIKAPDLGGSVIAVGVLVHIAAQVLINIAVVTNSIPPTGVTLPFISYGGTSLVFLLIEMGLVLGVSRQIKLKR